jgi:hypothetical protein
MELREKETTNNESKTCEDIASSGSSWISNVLVRQRILSTFLY